MMEEIKDPKDPHPISFSLFQVTHQHFSLPIFLSRYNTKLRDEPTVISYPYAISLPDPDRVPDPLQHILPYSTAALLFAEMAPGRGDFQMNWGQQLPPSSSFLLG